MFQAISKKRIEKLISQHGLYPLYFKEGSYYKAFKTKEEFNTAYLASFKKDENALKIS